MGVGSGTSTRSQCLEARIPGQVYKDLGGLVITECSVFLNTGFPEDVFLCVVPNVLVYPTAIGAGD